MKELYFAIKYETKGNCCSDDLISTPAYIKHCMCEL
jgi:hypothetical protein